MRGLGSRCAAIVLAAVAAVFGPAGAAQAAEPTGRLVFRFIDAQTNDPVAGACVTASSGPSSPSGCSDADGRVVFRRVPVGTYSFHPTEPPGYQWPGAINDVVVTAGETTRVRIELARPAVLEITIRDSATQEPVSNACVSYVEEQTHNVGSPQPNFCSDRDGKVVLSSHPVRLRLFVVPFDGVHGMQWVGVNGGTGDVDLAQWFQTREGTVTAVDVKLDGAGTIVGTITDAETGAGVDRACPWITPQPGGQIVFCTGETGEYQIHNVGPYDWKVQFADYSGAHAWQWSGNAADRATATPVRVRVGETSVANASLPAAGRITGTIVGATFPPQFVNASSFNSVTGDFAGPNAFVRADYSYELAGLATQSVRIIYSGSHDGEQTHPDLVNIVAGQTVAGVTLTIPGDLTIPEAPAASRGRADPA